MTGFGFLPCSQATKYTLSVSSSTTTTVQYLVHKMLQGTAKHLYEYSVRMHTNSIPIANIWSASSQASKTYKLHVVCDRC